MWLTFLGHVEPSDELEDGDLDIQHRRTGVVEELATGENCIMTHGTLGMDSQACTDIDWTLRVLHNASLTARLTASPE
jgi:hypothetical protein